MKLKETRKKIQSASALCFVPPKGALGRGKSMARISLATSPGTGVRAGHTDVPSVTLLFGKEGREWRGGSAFLI